MGRDTAALTVLAGTCGGLPPSHFFSFPFFPGDANGGVGRALAEKEKARWTSCSSVPLFLLVHREKKNSINIYAAALLPSHLSVYLSSTPLWSSSNSFWNNNNKKKPQTENGNQFYLFTFRRSKVMILRTALHVFLLLLCCLLQSQVNLKMAFSAFRPQHLPTLHLSCRSDANGFAFFSPCFEF